MRVFFDQCSVRGVDVQLASGALAGQMARLSSPVFAQHPGLFFCAKVWHYTGPEDHALAIALCEALVDALDQDVDDSADSPTVIL